MVRPAMLLVKLPLGKRQNADLDSATMNMLRFSLAVTSLDQIKYESSAEITRYKFWR